MEGNIFSKKEEKTSVAKKTEHARVRTDNSTRLLPKDLYGAIDLGTNSCRLLIAAPSRDGFEVRDAFSRIVRLGEGLQSSGKLNEMAMERTIGALRVCASKLNRRKVGKRKLMATEACRLASNGRDFLEQIIQETGLKLEIIDQKTEAHLVAQGVSPLINQTAQSVLVFDIGGGSTELVWMRARNRAYHVEDWISIAAGVVTLSESFGGGKEVTPQIFSLMRAAVRPMLTSFVEKIQNLRKGDIYPDHLLGTSGTVTTIAGIYLNLPYYDRQLVDGCWLEEDHIPEVIAKLMSMNYEERRKHLCIGKDRADLILAGCAILEEIRFAFPSPLIRAADRGLREGALTRMMQTDGVYGAYL